MLAAAVHGQASIIVTLNLRHFRPEHLKPWGIRALHPQSFLNEIFREEQMLVMKKLKQQAADRGRSLRQLLNILSATVPEFMALVSSTLLERRAVSRRSADYSSVIGISSPRLICNSN